MSLNGDGNENGIKINRSTKQKNKFARAARFLFGRGPNRVMKTACFDANVQ